MLLFILLISFLFWNARQGTLIIRKLDSITKAPLGGAEFSVRYADGRVVDNANGHISSNGIYTTNRNGEIVISGLTGTVVVTEEKAPDGYLLDVNSKTQTVVVNADDTQTLVFYDTPIGGLIITKSDEETGARISGVSGGGPSGVRDLSACPLDLRRKPSGDPRSLC